MKDELVLYGRFMDKVKSRIRQAQMQAVLSANAEMIMMYRDIGRMIDERQQSEEWEAKIIPRISKDLRNELPKVKDFSERNIGYMIRFAREYPEPGILQQGVAKNLTRDKIKSILGDPNSKTSILHLVLGIPWVHRRSSVPSIEEIETELSGGIKESKKKGNRPWNMMNSS